MAKVDKRFIVQLKGKEFVTYEGLLDTAHQIGLESIRTELIQLPDDSNKNTAVAKAVITSKGGEIFEEFGDASPASVNGMIKPHIIRMALTRAKARALRDLTNIGMTAIEELGEEDKGQTGFAKKANKVKQRNPNLINLDKAREIYKVWESDPRAKNMVEGVALAHSVETDGKGLFIQKLPKEAEETFNEAYGLFKTGEY